MSVSFLIIEWPTALTDITVSIYVKVAFVLVDS